MPRAFNYIDEEAVLRMKMNTDPYDWGYIPDAIPNIYLDKVLAEAPVIPARGSYPIKSYFGLPALKRGPEFQKLLDDLLSDRFRDLVSKLVGMDLTPYPPCIVMMGNTSGHYNEGYAHPDSRHKIVTVLIGLTREWPFERGRLRILRGPDRNDYAFEFAPEFGCMFCFKVSDKSWHGFLPQKGPRMSLQLCYVDTPAHVRREYFRHGLSALFKANPFVNKVLSYMPKNLWGLLPGRNR